MLVITRTPRLLPKQSGYGGWLHKKRLLKKRAVDRFLSRALG